MNEIQPHPPRPESPPAPVLIAGCGQLGTEAGHLLVQAGHKVHGLRRSAERLPAELHPLAVDLSRPGRIPDLPEVETVLFILTPGAYDDDAYRQAYVDNLANLLRALEGQELTPHRLIYVSSTSVYAQTDGSWVDESSPTEPSSFSGRRLLQGESLALDSFVPEVSVLRFGGIYGPTRLRLLRSVESGKARCYDTPAIWTNRIHSTDAARALVHLVGLPEVESSYLGVDTTPSLDGEVKRWLAARLQVKPPPVAEAAPSSESRAMRSNKRCSSQRLQESGFEFSYPSYQAGYSAILDSNDL